MHKPVKKSTEKSDGNCGLDWFVQAGHGGIGNRNCSLVDDASLATPDYPLVAGQGPTTTWAASIGATKLKGDGGGAGGSGNMLASNSLLTPAGLGGPQRRRPHHADRPAPAAGQRRWTQAVGRLWRR